jgi:hypothetical protein
MKTSTVRLVAVMAALAVVAVIVPAGRAVFNGVTDNAANSFATAASFGSPSFRVVTYEVKTGDFTGTTHILTLNQDLVADYFVLVRGAAGDYTSGGDRGPAADYARIDRDPHGNFTGDSPGTNALRLARGSTTGDWTGQVTVVECIADCDASGFRLHRVNEVTMTSGDTSGGSSTGGAWGSGNLGQIGLYGGSYGGGMETTATAPDNHKTGWARIYPSGSANVFVSRGGPDIGGTTIFSIYVVKWGTEWTIQRARVQGTNGGNGMDSTSHYNTATISSVARENTWVVAYGRVGGNTLDEGWEGQTWTLGDGVNVNATETLVAVGSETGVQRDVEVYIHTHPDLFNQYLFGPDNTAPGIITGNLSGTATIVGPKSPETHNSSDTAGRRFPIVANTSNGATTLYPRPIVWGQLDADTTARWQRSRSGEPGTYWLQTPDFGDIAEANEGNGVKILDAWTTGTTHAVSAGTNRLLLVGVYGEDTGAIASVNTVTWGGQTVTEIDEAIVGTGYSNLAWLGYLDDAGIAAASGDTIIATWSGSPPDSAISYAAVTLANVDQSTPTGGSSTGTALNASSVQPTGSLSVDPDDRAVYITVAGGQETHTAATGYTEGTSEWSGGSVQTSANADKAITATGTEQPSAGWTTSNRLAIISTVINVN